MILNLQNNQCETVYGGVEFQISTDCGLPQHVWIYDMNDNFVAFRHDDLVLASDRVVITEFVSLKPGQYKVEYYYYSSYKLVSKFIRFADGTAGYFMIREGTGARTKVEATLIVK